MQLGTVLVDDIANRIDALRKQDAVKDREAKQQEKAHRIAALQRQKRKNKNEKFTVSPK
jgi:hypothetical protein